MCRIINLSLLVCFLSFVVGCDNDECSSDGDCPRAQICDGSSCVALPCSTAADCPEGNRTCLLGYGTCGSKECNTGNSVEDQCSSALCDTATFTCLTQCSSDEECALAGVDMTCQNDICRPRRRSVGTPDVALVGGPDMGSSSDAGSGTDMGFVPQGVACAPCSGDSECASLGAGAVCEALGESAYCFGQCGENGACPTGFSCREGIGLCVPVNGSCEVCPGKPCAPGLVCNPSSGECVDAGGICDTCFGPDTCADGAECVELDGRNVCLQACPEAGCAAGTSCQSGHCVPDNVGCDPCEGRCAGMTPVCIEDDGRCGQCGPGTPCNDGQVCNSDTWMCEVPSMCDECINDDDCGTCAGRSICLSGQCVACLQQSDCPPRFECDTQTFTCVSSPCSGVACQMNTSCNPATGRCENASGGPGCTSPADCATMEMGCNLETGQCFYADGTCDINPGGPGVCSPGSECIVDGLAALGGETRTVCTCNNYGPEPPVVACHPGVSCNQIPPGLLPAIPGLDLEGGTCGESPF